MMDIKLEKLNGHSKEGVIGKIHVKVGDTINVGDLLLQVESNKGSSPIKSEVSGTIEEIFVEEGQKVSLQDGLMRLDGVDVVEKATDNNQFNYFSTVLKPKKEELTADLVVIGGGPGGYVASIYAAQKGLKVVLVEKERVGGTCLNLGCIPTKALVRSAEVYTNIKQAKDFGLDVDQCSVDMKKVIERKNSIVNQLTQGIDYLLEKHGIKQLAGIGKIIDDKTVYTKTKSKEVTITTKNIIIATGSQVYLPPIKGADSQYVITSNEALSLNELPHKLTIVGGGIIGMEFAFIYAQFGVDVTVIEFQDQILSVLDEDVSKEIETSAKQYGIKIYTQSKVTAIKDTEDKRAIIEFIQQDETKCITADKVLMAVGRIPYTDELGLENIELEMNEQNRGIQVDNKMLTTVPSIYAIGDVTNKIQLAHVASHQGITAINNILGHKEEMSYDIIPSAIFTTPEICAVGIGEKEAKEKGLDVSIGKFPYAANGKALTLGETEGFVKIIKDNQTGKIIGSTIIGAHAADLLSTVTVAIKNELTTKDLQETIFAHPTTAETIHEAVLATEGGALHFAE